MAGALTAGQLRSACKSGRLPSILVIVGDDEQEKSELITAVQRVVEADLEAFNVQRFYSDDADLSDVVSAARTVPLLGDWRVVVLSRIERLFKRGGKKADDDDAADAVDEPGSTKLAPLEEYVSRPVEGTVLVLVGSDINRATRLGKLLVKHAAMVECWGLKADKDTKGYNAVPAALSKAAGIVKDRIRAAGMTISEDAVVPLLEHCGTNIAVLRGDLDRLLLYCAGRSAITRADVLQVVGGATQIDEWAMTRAIEQGAAGPALRELALALESGAAPYQVLGQLAWLVRANMVNFAPTRVGVAIDAVFRTDQALKGSGGEPRLLLERLVVELCGPPSGRRPARPLGRR